MEQEQTAPESAMSAEQAADRAALLAAVAESEAQGVAGGGGAAAPVEVGPDLAQELTGLILAFVAVATPIFPSLGEIYTPETTGAAAGAVASVCNKHGWLSGGVMGEWAEEVTAAIVLLPLAVATNNGIRADLEKRRRIEEKKKADYQAHLTITRNLDGQTDLSGAPGPVAGVQGWQPPAPVEVKANPGWGKA